MKSESKFRQWANRDDGKHFRVGNLDIGALTVAGALVWITGLLLFQLYLKDLIHFGWALGTSVLGLGLFACGFAKDDRNRGT